MEWVEVRGKTIDVAIEAAMHELGIEDRDRLSIEVIQQPERGFLGIGGRDAIVRVKPKDASRRRRRRRRRGSEAAGSAGDGNRPRQGRQDRGRQGESRQGDRRQGQGRQGETRSREGREQPRSGGERRDRQARHGRSGGGAGSGGSERRREEREAGVEEERIVAIEEQAPVVEEFLAGLVQAFGLEGDVRVRTEDGDTIVAEVHGSQTEAMVGPRGSVIEAIHELTKTVLQRKTQASARVRLDIAGYAERRRQALTIYAGQLIDQVLEEGGEVTLEPMSASDRKVIHDAVADREGVRSYSEGEAPERYVVIAKVEGEDEEPRDEHPGEGGIGEGPAVERSDLPLDEEE